MTFLRREIGKEEAVINQITCPRLCCLKIHSLLICLICLFSGSGVVFAGQHINANNLEHIQAQFVFRIAPFVIDNKSMTALKKEKPVICFYGLSAQKTRVQTMNNSNKYTLAFFNSLIDIDNCAIVYLGEGAEPHLPNILLTLENKSILTISSIKNFALKGGMISLDLEGAKIVFDCNLNTMRSNGINMSSKVLELARDVF